MVATPTGSLSLSLAPVLTLALAILSSSAVTAASVWHVSIDNKPAPSPEDGPPLSANASRDRSLLPTQIGSIFGAYFLSVLIIGTAIFLIGLRLRRAAQASPRTLDMEMVKPQASTNAYDPSPISPTRHRAFDPSPVSAADTKITWPSPDNAKNAFNWPSPTKTHKQHASQQGSVVTFDESVIEDDKAKGQREMERLYAAVMEHDAKQSSVVYDANRQPIIQQPPELQHLRQPLSPSKQDRISSPPLRSNPASPPRKLLSKASKPSPISISAPSAHSRTSSRTSFGSFSKKRGIRGLPISPPMGSPDLARYNTSPYGDEQALSPRYYDPGPPPPKPPQREGASRNLTKSPTSPTHRTSSTQHQQYPLTSTNLQNATSQYTQAESQGPQNLYRSHQPTPLPLRTQAALGPTTPTTSQLPFRSANTYSDRPQSTIKATVLERKLNPHSALRTGVPATPYSPYMPFTPLTPITPRLLTRQERKRKEKEEGRRVATVEDRVEEEADMWGDAYH